jgi:hypothetical protein
MCHLSGIHFTNSHIEHVIITDCTKFKKMWRSDEVHCHNLPEKFRENTVGVETREHRTA